MKKIVVASDNHGDKEILDKIREDNKDASLFVHCGDSEMTEEEMKDWIVITGNNDWQADFPVALKFKVDQITFVVTHGNQFGYWDRDGQMEDMLIENDADVLLSGHTHFPTDKKYHGYRFINPGSTSLPRGGSPYMYAILYVQGKELEVQFVELENDVFSGWLD